MSVTLTLNPVDFEICRAGNIRCQTTWLESSTCGLPDYQDSCAQVRSKRMLHGFTLTCSTLPRPTVEARHALYTTAQRHAEDARAHIRKQHSASVKKGGFKKFSQEFDEVSFRRDVGLEDASDLLASISCKNSTTSTSRKSTRFCPSSRRVLVRNERSSDCAVC